MMGDSKTAGNGYENQGQSTLVANLLATGNWPNGVFLDRAMQLAGSGWTVATLDSNTAAWLSPLNTKPAPDFVFINIGANDIGVTGQSAFETSLGSILDKVHTKWPNTPVFVWKIWRGDSAGNSTASDTMDDTWIPNVLSTRSAFASSPSQMDERVTLKSSDNGATYMDADKIHPNAAGRVREAEAIQAAMGY